MKIKVYKIFIPVVVN